MEKLPQRRTGSREPNSRFVSPAASSDTRRRSKPLRSADDSAALLRLWPSSSSKKLADHLDSDRLADAPPLISRQRSCSEFRRLDGGEVNFRASSKETHRPLGGSMCYIGKLRFPRSTKPEPTFPSSPPLATARISVDESALTSRRRSDFALDFPSSESDRSGSSSSHKPPTQRSPAVRRMGSPAASYGSAATQWALSPGRRSRSPPMVDGDARPAAAGVRAFSSLRPSSPGKGRGVGNFISLGLDLFRRKSFSGSSPHSSTFSPTAGSVTVVGEMGHQFRMAHNRLIQWRDINARADAVIQFKTAHTEAALMSAEAALLKLQALLLQNQLQMEKQKLRLKLNQVLLSQIKPLEAWGDVERKHTSAISAIKDCLQAVISIVPLIEGAKADTQPLLASLRQANDVALKIKSNIGVFNHMDKKRVPLLSELAWVVTREKFLLEECFELLILVSVLHVQEQSFKCHLLQVKSLQKHQLLEDGTSTICN